MKDVGVETLANGSCLDFCHELGILWRSHWMILLVTWRRMSRGRVVDATIEVQTGKLVACFACPDDVT